MVLKLIFIFAVSFSTLITADSIDTNLAILGVSRSDYEAAENKKSLLRKKLIQAQNENGADSPESQKANKAYQELVAKKNTSSDTKKSSQKTQFKAVDGHGMMPTPDSVDNKILKKYISEAIEGVKEIVSSKEVNPKKMLKRLKEMEAIAKKGNFSEIPFADREMHWASFAAYFNYGKADSVLQKLDANIIHQFDNILENNKQFYTENSEESRSIIRSINDQKAQIWEAYIRPLKELTTNPEKSHSEVAKKRIQEIKDIFNRKPKKSILTLGLTSIQPVASPEESNILKHVFESKSLIAENFLPLLLDTNDKQNVSAKRLLHLILRPSDAHKKVKALQTLQTVLEKNALLLASNKSKNYQDILSSQKSVSSTVQKLIKKLPREVRNSAISTLTKYYGIQFNPTNMAEFNPVRQLNALTQAADTLKTLGRSDLEVKSFHMDNWKKSISNFVLRAPAEGIKEALASVFEQDLKIPSSADPQSYKKVFLDSALSSNKTPEDAYSKLFVDWANETKLNAARTMFLDNLSDAHLLDIINFQLTRSGQVTDQYFLPRLLDSLDSRIGDGSNKRVFNLARKSMKTIYLDESLPTASKRVAQIYKRIGVSAPEKIIHTKLTSDISKTKGQHQDNNKKPAIKKKSIKTIILSAGRGISGFCKRLISGRGAKK